MNIPVYVFLGFLESGKTQFVKDTLRDPGFTDQEKTLIIQCEDGEEQYDRKFLTETNSVLFEIDGKEDFQGAKLKKAATSVKPDRIIVEYNGMWDLTLMEQEFPRNWDVYQFVTSINAETYELYLNNMGPQLIQHVGNSELVIFNRCTPELKDYIRSTSVNAMNPRALIFLEDTDGNAEDYRDGLPLPFDLDAPVIEIGDDDFGTWYVDAMNDPSKYDGKTIRFKGQLHRIPNDPPDHFVAGRFAMTCCVEDISFLGTFCRMKGAAELVDEESWADLTAEVRTEYVPEFHGDAPVLYVSDLVPSDKPKEELLLFR